MNRRKFFNFLGGAVIGTVITLKLPDTIAPLNKFVSDFGVITYSKLLEAYNHCREKYGEPDSIVLTKKQYEKLCELTSYSISKKQEENADGQHLMFQNAVVQSTTSCAIKDNEMMLFANGGFSRHAKKYDFV